MKSKRRKPRYHLVPYMVLCLLALCLADLAAYALREAVAQPSNALFSTKTAPPPAKLVTAAWRSKDTLIEPKGNEAVTEFWQSRSAPGEPGGSLTLSTFGSGIKTFNLWSATESEAHGVGLLLFDPLVQADPWTGLTTPKLAKSVSLSADQCEYTFTLRKGLQWSDGHALTADDVLFTFGKLVKEGFGNSSYRDPLTVAGQYPEVIKVDDLTVKFKTAKPFAPFAHCLQSIGIAPKHALEKYLSGKDAHDKFHAVWDINSDLSEIVTCGPFKVGRYVPGQRIELVRNPYYAMCDTNGRRLPYLNKFTVVIVPDQNAEIVKFLGNELDMLDVKQVRGSDAFMLKQREKAGNFSIYNLGPNDGVVFLVFNMNRRISPKKKTPYVDPVKQAWFNDVNFRQAVNHAISRKRIINNALRGVGYELYTPMSPASLFFNQTLKGFPQDLELAQNLLKKSGFQLRGDELYDRTGHRVEFTLNTNSGNTTRDAICIAIQNDLKKLGMKVNYQPIDWNILVDKTNSSLEWETIVMALTGDKLEPYEGANVWKSNGRLHIFDTRLPGPNGTTVCTDARDWEKEIDQLFDAGASTFELDKRRGYFNRFQKIVYDQAPYVYIEAQVDIVAIRNTVGNYNPTPLGITYNPIGSLRNIAEVYVKFKKH